MLSYRQKDRSADPGWLLLDGLAFSWYTLQAAAGIKGLLNGDYYAFWFDVFWIFVWVFIYVHWEDLLYWWIDRYREDRLTVIKIGGH